MSEWGTWSRIEAITPAAAARCLDTRRSGRRSVFRGKVDRLKGVIAAGEWDEDLAPIELMVSRRADLDRLSLGWDVVVDGRHRLTAIAEGDVTVRVLVIRTGPDDTLAREAYREAVRKVVREAVREALPRVPREALAPGLPIWERYRLIAEANQPR